MQEKVQAQRYAYGTVTCRNAEEDEKRRRRYSDNVYHSQLWSGGVEYFTHVYTPITQRLARELGNRLLSRYVCIQHVRMVYIANKATF